VIYRKRHGWVRLFLLLAAIGMNAVPAYAQAVPSIEEAAKPASEAEAAADPENVDIRDLDLDWSQLDVDAYTLMTASPTSKPSLAPRARRDETIWSSIEKPNASAVSVKQSISPFWNANVDSRIGADMTVVRQPTTLSELLAEKAANGGNEPQSSGTAWATITAPGVDSIWDKTAVEARVDPSQDQSKLATSLSKSLALGEQYLLILQNGYSFTQQGVFAAPTTAAHAAHNFETGQSARLNITESGTSFSAGQTLSSSDDKWLRKIGAEQKLFGALSISGSISETPQGAPNRSISAGFKQSW
jgi:hypothetical protein